MGGASRCWRISGVARWQVSGGPVLAHGGWVHCTGAQLDCTEAWFGCTGPQRRRENSLQVAPHLHGRALRLSRLSAELSHEFNVCYATTHSNVFPFPNFHINFLNMSKKKNTSRKSKNVFCRFSFVKFWHFHHPLLMRFSEMSIKKNTHTPLLPPKKTRTWKPSH